LLAAYAPAYFTDRYTTEWGAAINFDGDDAGPVREFFLENAAYWIREFHLDGLRFDATQAILDESPTDVLQRNFWWCALDDESAWKTRERIGVDHIVVESDYPHADSTWPDTQPLLREHLTGMSDADKINDWSVRYILPPMPLFPEVQGNGSDELPDIDFDVIPKQS